MLRVATLRTSTSIVDSLYPDFLKTILNAHGITKIGNYIIKVDMANEKVLVLKNEDKQYYNDLVSNNYSNSKMLVYSTNDEVLELLVNNILPSQSLNTASSNQRTTLFCNQKAAGPNKYPTNEFDGLEYYRPNTQWRLKCEIVNNNSGIYFSLNASAAKQNNAFGDNDDTDVWLDYNFTCTPKCKSSRSGSGTVWEQDKHSINYRAYESTTGLASYTYSARFRTENGYITKIYSISR